MTISQDKKLRSLRSKMRADAKFMKITKTIRMKRIFALILRKLGLYE